jgi:hypothetical protein
MQQPLSLLHARDFFTKAHIDPFFYLFLIFLPHFEHFLVGKRNSVHALQGVIVRAPQPIGGRMSRGTKRLDFAGILNMRTTTKVNQIAAAIHSGAAAVGYLGRENSLFERIVAKKFKALFFGNNKAFEFLLLFDNLLHLCLDWGYFIF